MAYLFWTEFTASAIATCTLAMLRLQGLPAMFAAFIAAMAVWFQSVMTSALAGDDSATTRHTLAAVTPLKIARGIILMVASWLSSDCWLCPRHHWASSRLRI